MPLRLPASVLSLLPFALPILAIALARLLTFTDWAAANAGWTALLFAWVVADALMLGVMAKAKDHKPEAFKMLAALALASVVILIAAAEPIRAIYFDLPAVLAAAAGTLAIFLGWSALRISSAYRETGSASQAAERVLPAPLVKHLASELNVLWLGLFRWNAPVQVPVGAQSFVYHTYLTPMIVTFVVLQVIEISVVHLLVMLWNPTVAWVLFALSAWGLIWTMALLKSLRIKPVLLSENCVHARFGILHDVEVPLSAIGDIDTPYSSEELEDKGVLNMALMSAPNVHLRLAQPIAIPSLLGRERLITGVALKLDDSAGFVAALKENWKAREQI